MANIEWTMITAGRFVSNDGNFSIAPIYQGGTFTTYRFALTSKFGGKTKVYNYITLEDAFIGVQNIAVTNYGRNGIPNDT